MLNATMNRDRKRCVGFGSKPKNMAMKPTKFNRLFHRWASIAVALPVLIVIVTGLILLLKKTSAGSKYRPFVESRRNSH